MEDKYSGGRKHSGIWKSLRDEEFGEEEIWDVLESRSGYSFCGVDKFKEKDNSSSLAVMSGLMIPRGSNSSNNSSVSSSDETMPLQHSAPVNIPDWSKIYRTDQNKASKSNASRFDDYDDDDVADDDGGVNYGEDSDELQEDKDECDANLPPHEFIAKRLARSQISSFSVLEGAGRTLKGRDLSKMRNAVLTKTGFLESL